MEAKNIVLVKLGETVLAVAKNLLYWPLWWYSRGLFGVLKATLKKIAGAWEGLVLGIWLKNIFRPMYGMHDTASRVISFLMRLVQIIFRLIIMVILTAFILLIPVVYLALPIITVWQLIKF